MNKSFQFILFMYSFLKEASNNRGRLYRGEWIDGLKKMQVIKKSIVLVGPTLPQMHGNLIFTYYSKFLLFIFFFFFWGGGEGGPTVYLAPPQEGKLCISYTT